MSDQPFNTDEPIAFFITWTTYGTWLPGDDRGWRRRGDGERKPPNQPFMEMARADMKETPFFLSPADRVVVENTIARHCDIRSWILHTVRARSNHVHVVVTAPDYDPETVRDQFKAWCTRHLHASNSGRKRFWTEGASCRCINRVEDLESAIVYVKDAQDRKDGITSSQPPCRGPRTMRDRIA